MNTEKYGTILPQCCEAFNVIFQIEEHSKVVTYRYLISWLFVDFTYSEDTICNDVDADQIHIPVTVTVLGNSCDGLWVNTVQTHVDILRCQSTDWPG